MIILQSLLKHLLILSVLTLSAVAFYKDKLPEPNFYDINSLAEPAQYVTDRQPFQSQVGGQEYKIIPKYDYELQGVVVSYNNADGITDIWHHKRWQDFLNERDLCVIWGENVQNGVYKQIKFVSDSWTCWFSWSDSATGARFKSNAISNNHLLVDNDKVRAALMASELGDHVRFKGVLAEYQNPANNFYRGTSTNRNDTGNGACETVYLTDFEVVKKANVGLRKTYVIAKYTALIALMGFLVLFCITPVRNK